VVDGLLCADAAEAGLRHLRRDVVERAQVRREALDADPRVGGLAPQRLARGRGLAAQASGRHARRRCHCPRVC